MYKLYHDRKRGILEISPIKPEDYMSRNITEDVHSYNDCYFICTDRKKLREYAYKLKANWLIHAEWELNRLESVSLKNKY